MGAEVLPTGNASFLSLSLSFPSVSSFLPLFLCSSSLFLSFFSSFPHSFLLILPLFFFPFSSFLSPFLFPSFCSSVLFPFSVLSLLFFPFVSLYSLLLLLSLRPPHCLWIWAAPALHPELPPPPWGQPPLSGQLFPPDCSFPLQPGARRKDSSLEQVLKEVRSSRRKAVGCHIPVPSC